MSHRPCDKNTKHATLRYMHFNFLYEIKSKNFLSDGLPVDSNDRSEQTWTSWNNIGEDELKSCVVGFCQDVECFCLAP